MCVHACNICAGPFMLLKPKHLKSIEFPPLGKFSRWFLLYLNFVLANNVGRRRKGKEPTSCVSDRGATLCHLTLY